MATELHQVSINSIHIFLTNLVLMKAKAMDLYLPRSFQAIRELNPQFAG